MPVTIVNFTATPNASDVKLNWVVAEQINISSDYTVEWSTDGKHFQLGILPATNTSSYIMLHKKPATGLNYYRLKILENDGRVSFTAGLQQCILIFHRKSLLSPTLLNLLLM